MFDFIFDLSYERNIHEAIVFYFCYTIFAIYLWILAICILFYIIQDVFIRNILIIVLTPFVPIIFYICIAILLCIKKNCKDRNNIIFVISTISLTLVIPGLTGTILGITLSPTSPKLTLIAIIGGTIVGVNLFFISAILLGGIPVAILSTRECLTDQKKMRKMDQEKIKQEIHVEKLLLMEQLLINDLEEQNNDINDNRCG